MAPQSHEHMHKHENLQIKNISRYFLIGCFGITLWYFFLIIKPFISMLILSVVLAVGLAPLHRKILTHIRYKNISAVIACILVVFFIMLPVALLIILLWNEATSLYLIIQSKIQSGDFSTYPIFSTHSIDLSKQIGTIMSGGKDFIFQQAQIFLSLSFNVISSFFIMIVALFYFFRDGNQMVTKLTHLSPLPERQELLLISKIRSLMSTVLFGSLLTASTQGVLGGIGFAIAGTGQPLLWGTLVGVFSLIPFIGGMLIWVPAVAILFLTGNQGHAIFLLLWASMIMSVTDSILRSVFIGHQTKMHPFLMFGVVFGGMMVWGGSGIVIGPLLVILVMAFSQMYRQLRQQQ